MGGIEGALPYQPEVTVRDARELSARAFLIYVPIAQG